MERPETVRLAYLSWLVMAAATCLGFALIAVSAAVTRQWAPVAINAVFAVLFAALITFFARSVYFRFAHPDRSLRTLWMLSILVLYDAVFVALSQMEGPLWVVLPTGWVHICAAVAGMVALWLSTRQDATAWVKGE